MHLELLYLCLLSWLRMYFAIARLLDSLALSLMFERKLALVYTCFWKGLRAVARARRLYSAMQVSSMLMVLEVTVPEAPQGFPDLRAHYTCKVNLSFLDVRRGDNRLGGVLDLCRSRGTLEM